MLSASRYLLGIAEILLLIATSTLGATALRKRLVPSLSGSTAVLSTIVLISALLIWCAEVLGTFGAFKAVPYLLLVAVVGVGIFGFSGGWRGKERGPRTTVDRPQAPSHSRDRTRPPIPTVPLLFSLAVALFAILGFASGVHDRLDTGMTGFDSTWYHGPFAAGFHQTGNTWDLHYIAPAFMAWFYPANSEIFHAIGMNAFDRDLLSPLLNLGWFVGCLLAAWCIGRPYRMSPVSLALAAVALSLSVLSDQAGEARNDIVGIFFLLAAVAIAINSRPTSTSRGIPTGAIALVGLSAGLAAGTKLNFVLPAAVLVLALAWLAPSGRRMAALGAGGLASLAGGGYWYLRNLVHTGNPLPWFDSVGPISLPGPSQDLGGREAHSVLSYLGDGSIWSDWFAPGLHHGLGRLWPLILLLALGGLVLALSRRAGPAMRASGLAGLAALLAWLVAPTSASGPEGMPRGFESGLRYLAPALVLGMALLPIAPAVRSRLDHLGRRFSSQATLPFVAHRATKGRGRRPSGRWLLPAALLLAGIVVIAAGYAIQRDYLRDRYANPSFSTPGLDAAFKWATPISGARIATTGTRQYPLFGTDLSNRVEFVGEHRSQGGFVAPATCPAWRRLLDEGHYDYVVATRDRVEPGKPPYPPTAHWTEGPNATVILRKPPTVVFKLTGPLSPSTCPS